MKAYDMKRGTVVEHVGRIWQIKDVERSAPHRSRRQHDVSLHAMYSVPGDVKLDLSLRADDDLPEVELSRRAGHVLVHGRRRLRLP
jgi:elongation factor P